MLLPRISPTVGVILLVQCHMSAAEPAPAQEAKTSQAIERTIGQFFTSISKRDVKGVQAVLDTHLTVIEAAGNKARLHLIAPDTPEELLPPEGNDDFANISIVDVKAETSKTHPSVAMASFTLVRPLDAKTTAIYERVLKAPPKDLSEAQIEAISQIAKDRAYRDHMFAMLVCQRGTWKIACMTVPK